MQLIQPTSITEAMLVYSSVAEADASLWSAGASYSIGDKCIKLSTHRIYQSLSDLNIAKDPELYPDLWLDTGPTNRWALFDGVVGTLTESTETITFSLMTRYGCTDLALLDVKGSEVTVTLDFNGTRVYSSTTPLTAVNNESNWYSYTYTPTDSRDSVVIRGLPSYVGAILTVTIKAITRKASVGTCILGALKTIGTTKYGASIGIQDYSVRARDEFGNITIGKRASSRRGKYSLELPKHLVKSVYKMLDNLRSTPVLYIGVEDDSDLGEVTMTLGFYKDFEIVISYPTYSDVSIEIEGLV